MSLFGNTKRKYFSRISKQLGCAKKDILVIVNIDDIGLHKDETEASFRALNYGMVKSGSIMVPCPNFHCAAELWKQNPEIDLGIHLTLTCEWGQKYPWTPVLSKSDVPSLYNPDGIMWKSIPQLLQNAVRKEIIMELEAQIMVLLNMGIRPSHLDDHMDLHNNYGFFPILMDLCKKYNLPMRVWKRRRYRYPFFKNNLISLRRKGYVFPESQKGFYYMGGDCQSYEFRKEKYYDHLRRLRPGIHNVKIHTAFKTEALQNIMGAHYSSVRQIDFDVWTSAETKRLAEELGIKFIGYRPLQRLQSEIMLNVETG
jgi:chitin disaccharide deacetylase